MGEKKEEYIEHLANQIAKESFKDRQISHGFRIMLKENPDLSRRVCAKVSTLQIKAQNPI